MTAGFSTTGLHTAEPEPSRTGNRKRVAAEATCFHCGTICGAEATRSGEKDFCCQGCLTVFEILSENGLENYYRLNEAAGRRVSAAAGPRRFEYLDQPTVRERLVDFQNEKLTRITFRIPAIHCIACVWLLENLFRIQPGIGQSQVHFPRKQLSVSFQTNGLRLSDLVALLASLGYEPDLKLSDLEAPSRNPAFRRLWLQLGVAGFAFGNNMLFSIGLYLGADAVSGPGFRAMVGYLSLALSLPVLLFSAQDYFRLAWNGLKHRLLTIEVPIAAGILVIFAQSAWEVISGLGEGYFDSFAGLLFFLLCGKLFQQKTYERLAFDRDFKSFFPLSVTRRRDGREESAALATLEVGDHLVLRHGELIPADSRLLSGTALIDYSFVTGESEPVEKAEGALLYAGGRQMGGAIELQTVKAVSQSYLTSLWNQEIFRKNTTVSLDTLINRYSQRFTRTVLGIAFAAALYWSFADSSRAVKSFTSVLIVACPCALALAAPFTLGTAIRVLGRSDVFVKSPEVIEELARIDTVVFDKTGTLTAAGAGSIQFIGEPLNRAEECWIYSMTRHSTHPYAVRIADAARNHFPENVRSFLETAGCGMEGSVAGHEIWMGSAAWFASRNVFVINSGAVKGSAVHIAIDGHYRGAYILESAVRRNAGNLLQSLDGRYDLALLSGDNERDAARFKNLFGNRARVFFNQSPFNKLSFIRDLQRQGRRVMMVGDGLNDAGALKQSHVGVAVVESIGAFSPASDIILSATMVPRLDAILRYSRESVRVVQLSFLISSLYNIAGIGIAASGRLAPIVCAILMPLSSITVVAFACTAATWRGQRAGLLKGDSK